MTNKSRESHSDFWLDGFDVGHNRSSDATRLIRLNSARRAVSNFVNILTGKVIPVVFNEASENLTDGKVVLLSADIEKNKDFDVAVGLSLHEGSHILLSDFRLILDLWQNVPRAVYNLAEAKGFSKTDAVCLVKLIFNVIEDRYIDRYVYSTAPGYRGYYQALYDKYWHSDKITIMLRSEMYRSATVKSYEARIINISNPHSDLDALPGLQEIARIINLKKIDRLKTTNDRLDVALEVVKVIYKNVESTEDDPIGPPDPADQLDQKSKINGSGDVTNDNTSTKSDNGDASSDDVDDILGGGTDSVDSSAPEKDSEKSTKENESSGLSKAVQSQIERALEKQRSFLIEDVRKKKVSQKDHRTLTQLEKAGVSIVTVGKLLIEGEPLTDGVECILVKNLTRDLLLSDQFPCKSYDCRTGPHKHMLDAVNNGIRLGVALGRKLKIRNEENTTKYMRKSTGKIDRRVLAELGCDNENVFYRMDVDKYKNTFIHISLDASSSMAGEKWVRSITSVTAICKASSMVDNLRVSVSIRSTIESNGTNLPYLVMVYDSAKDSIVKLRTLFPYLAPSGTTPEGLCYEAIMDLLGHKSVESDYYFLNFSDGQPCYEYRNEDYKKTYSYDQITGVNHTRRQVNEIRNRGYKVLAYFIENPQSPHLTTTYNNACESSFKRMYGQDARFVDVTNITGIARTMNQMFLEKEQKI